MSPQSEPAESGHSLAPQEYYPSPKELAARLEGHQVGGRTSIDAPSRRAGRDSAREVAMERNRPTDRGQAGRGVGSAQGPSQQVAEGAARASRTCSRRPLEPAEAGEGPAEAWHLIRSDRAGRPDTEASFRQWRKGRAFVQATPVKVV